MQSDAFEWDGEKAAQNYSRHGVSFETATKVFKDPLAIERLDDREDYGEERFILIGMTEGVLLVVTYTERVSASAFSQPGARRDMSKTLLPAEHLSRYGQ